MTQGIARRRYGTNGARYLPEVDWPEADLPEAGPELRGWNGEVALRLPQTMRDGRLRLPLAGEQHFYALGESGQPVTHSQHSR